MAQEEEPEQSPKAWARFTVSLGRRLPTRMREAQRTARRIRALTRPKRGK